MSKEYETIMRLNNGLGNINNLNLNTDIVIKNNKKRRIEISGYYNKEICVNKIDYELDKDIVEQISYFEKDLTNYINNLKLNYYEEELKKVDEKPFKEITELVSNEIYNILKNYNKLNNMYYAVVCDRYNNDSININRITIHIVYEINNHLFQPKYYIKNDPNKYKYINCEEFSNYLKCIPDKLMNNTNKWTFSSWFKQQKVNDKIKVYYIKRDDYDSYFSYDEKLKLSGMSRHSYNNNVRIDIIKMNTLFFEDNLLNKLSKLNIKTNEYKFSCKDFITYFTKKQKNEILNKTIELEESDNGFYNIVIDINLFENDIIDKLNIINILKNEENNSDTIPKGSALLYDNDKNCFKYYNVDSQKFINIPLNTTTIKNVNNINDDSNLSENSNIIYDSDLKPSLKLQIDNKYPIKEKDMLVIGIDVPIYKDIDYLKVDLSNG